MPYYLLAVEKKSRCRFEAQADTGYLLLDPERRGAKTRPCGRGVPAHERWMEGQTSGKKRQDAHPSRQPTCLSRLGQVRQDARGRPDSDQSTQMDGPTSL